jgi:hypothetical protein
MCDASDYAVGAVLG